MIAASARRLSVFRCVVEAGGFNAAAMRLGIAQPSVGAHIKALEAKLGQPLFARQRGTRPQLTPAGEALYAYAGEALARSAQASRTLADLRGARAREITVVVHRDLAPRFVSRHLGPFARRTTKTRVVTRIGTIEDVLALARSGEADLGVLVAEAPVSGLRGEVLAREPLMIVVAPEHPLARRKRVTADDIERYTFIGGLSGSSYARMMAKVLRRAGLRRYDVAMELQESSAVKEMVRHGVGPACLPACTVADELAARTLVALDLAFPLPPLDMRCVWRAPLHEPAAALLAHLRRAAATG
ncbi:MAG TPA: LysR family transcriptional regulator [Xanthobacteraceae bacterium]|nr:LysR family transcriptional regulator [Xanthobacteraceae bacterium]